MEDVIAMEESKSDVINEKPKVYEPTSLVVTHLPKDATKREIEDFFGEVGKIRKCHLVRDKEWVFKGMAYVVYNKWQDAAKAKDTLHRKQFRGSALRIKFSRTRKKDLQQKEKRKKGEKDKLLSEHYGEEIKETEEKKPRRKVKDRSKFDKNKEARKLREGRIIVRNLSFKADEKALEKHFSPYGKVIEVQIPRREDGKLIGIAFVQYETKLQALKAIKECNLKPLLGRLIAVDIAVAKRKFDSQKIKLEDTLDIKEEKMDFKEELEDPEDEKLIGSHSTNMKVKEEEYSDEESDSGLEDDGVNSDDENEESDEDESDDDDDSDEDEEEQSKPKRIPVSTTNPSKDVAEERTLFVKNLSFDATEEDILEVFSRHGEVKSVVICIDPLTEHPRGTAFVQFKDKSDAEACLAAEADPATKEQFVFLGRQMHVMKAISRADLESRKKEKEPEKVKDKRNLYLAREGLVRAGTRPAIGVSEADMSLRTMREKVKRRMLKNLNIFFSKTRLCIHNLPEKMTDAELRKVFLQHGDPSCVITEARVMRNLKDIGTDGKPTSRGYGFVTFTEHEHALNSLRRINNNPSIFTRAKRPVVEFSLENREVINAREKRLAKSKEKNPTWNKGKNTAQQPDEHDQQTKTNLLNVSDNAQEYPSFMGSKSDASVGANKALTTHIGPKIRKNGKISRNQLKKQKQDRKKGVKRLRVVDDNEAPKSKKQRGENKEENTKKKKKKKTLPKNFRTELRKDKAFTDMVQNYKRKMTAANSGPSKRWFED